MWGWNYFRETRDTSVDAYWAEPMKIMDDIMQVSIEGDTVMVIKTDSMREELFTIPAMPDDINYLVPRIAEKSFFETEILSYMPNEKEYDRMLKYFILKDPSDSNLDEHKRKEMINEYPICEKVPSRYILFLYLSGCIKASYS